MAPFGGKSIRCFNTNIRLPGITSATRIARNIKARAKSVSILVTFDALHPAVIQVHSESPLASTNTSCTVALTLNSLIVVLYVRMCLKFLHA